MYHTLTCARAHTCGLCSAAEWWYVIPIYPTTPKAPILLYNYLSALALYPRPKISSWCCQTVEVWFQFFILLWKVSLKIIELKCLSPNLIQVNLFQKPSFLHQLTHNMTRDCSLNSPKNTCSELVFFGEFNEQSLVILWVNWFKNESFWHRFTCAPDNP